MSEACKDKRILVLDNEGCNKGLTCEAFSPLGIELLTVADSEQALQILSRGKADALVADIKTSGLGFLSTVRKRFPDLAIIVMAGFGEGHLVTQTQLGSVATTILAEPFKQEDIVVAVRNAFVGKVISSATKALNMEGEILSPRVLVAEDDDSQRMLRESRELTDRIKKNNDQLKQLNEERERVLEVIAQDLRQPLIDQMNWCELLMSDSEHSLHMDQLESIAKLNSAAGGMFTRVLDLLDEEKIEERSRTIQEISAPEEPASPAEAEAPDSFDIVFRSENRSDFKILLVENCPVLRALLVSVLQRKFHVLSAADGWEALRLMVERPHLILTELDLPSVDVAELLRHARHIVEDLAVLAMCDAEDKALLAATQSLGVQETLLKPFRVAELVEKVEAFAQASRAGMDHSLLVVCPHPNERYALYHLLDTRYRTHLAASAETAMETAENHFDLLIIDTAAGEYPWEDVVTFFRGHHEDIRVLALIDRKDGTIAGALKKVGIDSALLKPYAFDDLLSRVQDLLGIKKVDGHILRSVFRKLA